LSRVSLIEGIIMEAKINNISQVNKELDMAMKHLERIQAFMNNVQEIMDQFNIIREGLNAAPVAGQMDPIHLSLADRVILIVRQFGHPVWPKAVAAEYENRGWPAPRGGTVYDAVNGAMSYLLHRRKLLGRNEEGYFVLPTTLSAQQTRGEKAGEATRA